MHGNLSLLGDTFTLSYMCLQKVKVDLILLVTPDLHVLRCSYLFSDRRQAAKLQIEMLVVQQLISCDVTKWQNWMRFDVTHEFIAQDKIYFLYSF